MADRSAIDRFVRAVHRRMVLLRSAERVGLCALGGCVMLLILMPILLYRGQAGGELAAAVLGGALAVGLVWAAMTRPSRLAAAMEADRQLKLADLLGTAWLMRSQKGDSDAMERAVMALAEARCLAGSPSMVVLHRLGARGWGGIALAGAMVFALSLMGPDTSQNQARAAHGPLSWREIEHGHEPLSAAGGGSKPDMRRVHEGSGSDEDPASNPGQTDTNETGKAVAAAPAGADAGDPGGADHGSGAAAGRSHVNPADKTAAEPNAAPGSGNLQRNGTAAGGGDATAEASGATPEGSGASGIGGGHGKRRRAAPIWQSNTWEADRQAAKAALRNGQVPDAYRELVREYFERE